MKVEPDGKSSEESKDFPDDNWASIAVLHASDDTLNFTIKVERNGETPDGKVLLDEEIIPATSGSTKEHATKRYGLAPGEVLSYNFNRGEGEERVRHTRWSFHVKAT